VATAKKINELVAAKKYKELWKLFEEYDVNVNALDPEVVKELAPIPKDAVGGLRDLVKGELENQKDIDAALNNMINLLFQRLDNISNNPNMSESERREETAQIYGLADKIHDTLAEMHGNNTKTILAAIAAFVTIVIVIFGGDKNSSNMA